MGSMRILIKGGKVVNDDFTQEADVYIENGIIQQVDRIYTHILYTCIHTLKHMLHPDLLLGHAHTPHTHCPAVSVTHFTITQYKRA